MTEQAGKPAQRFDCGCGLPFRSPIGVNKTVEKHRQSLMQKLNIHDVAGLTRYAIGAGIIESSVQLTIV